MTTTLWLRICAALSMLLAIGHTLGGRKLWSPMADNPVLQAMRTVHFDLGAASRSYLDFYTGFGYSISAFQFMVAVLLWQLASLARDDAGRVRSMIAKITLAIGACAGIAYVYILPLPAVFFAALFMSLLIAWVRAGRPTRKSQP